MTKSRLAFITGLAVLIVTALAVWSTLLNSPNKPGNRVGLTGPPQPRYETTFDRPRPELRIERLLGLDDSNGLNPDISSLFKRKEREQGQDTVNESGRTYQEVASFSHDKKGGVSDETGILRDAGRQW